MWLLNPEAPLPGLPFRTRLNFLDHSASSTTATPFINVLPDSSEEINAPHTTRLGLTT